MYQLIQTKTTVDTQTNGSLIHTKTSAKGDLIDYRVFLTHLSMVIREQKIILTSNLSADI